MLNKLIGDNAGFYSIQIYFLRTNKPNNTCGFIWVIFALAGRYLLPQFCPGKAVLRPHYLHGQPSICQCFFFLTFENMHTTITSDATVQNHIIHSKFLNREVKVDCYLPANNTQTHHLSLLLINDGQDLVTMDFQQILQNLYQANQLLPLLCVGLHCSADRKNEYATAKILDYKGRGAKAGLYSRFVLEEVLPYIRNTYHIKSFKEKSFAGFSLGALSAMDIVWNHPHEFTKMGAFSGSFWWRDKCQEDADFDEEKNRIMHRQVKEGAYHPWLKFFFEVGTQDETADRNNNGIIDAIDDTISLIAALKEKGYTDVDLKYLELQDGKHDVATWARAFPDFLKWGWGNEVIS